MRNEKTYVYNHPSSRTDGEKSAGNQGNHNLIRFQKNIFFQLNRCYMNISTM